MTNDQRSTTERKTDASGLRRFAAEAVRSPRRPPGVNIAILIGLIVLFLVAIYLLFFPRPTVESDVFSLEQSIERIEELSTVRSHLRFAVVVREESGNVIIRELADAAGDIDMSDIGSMLFQDPTLIVELHGVATYGIKLDDIDTRIEEIDDERIAIDLPDPVLLDVKIVNRDTKVIGRMEGLFRSSDNELMLEASREGERFAEEYALKDSTSLELAGERARTVVRMIAEGGGKQVVFDRAEYENETRSRNEEGETE